MAKKTEKQNQASDSIHEEYPEAINTQELNPIEESDPAMEIQELKDQNLRLYAEFENFRRRNARERLELMATANEKVIKALLPVIDDFERALKNISPESPERVGLELIYTKLLSTLKAEGLKEMDHTAGNVFDVETMEAITNIPAPSPDLAGKVVDQIEKGFLLGEKIIRYAKVVVGEHLAS